MAKSAQQIEEERQQRVQTGTRKVDEMFGDAFNDDYYAKLNQATLDFYRPQLADQYNSALKQLQFALARTGNLNSTARAIKESDLNKANLLNDQQIQEMARGTVNQRRQDVAGAQNTALAQLQSSADPAAAAAQSANLIKTNTAMPAYQPLGQVFQDATAGLATQAQLERQGNARYNLGVSNWGNNLKRYVQNISG